MPPRIEPPNPLRLLGDLLARVSRDRLARGEEPLSDDELRAAVADGPEALERVALTYGVGLGTPRYTLGTVARLAGLEPDQAGRLWLAFGFALPGPTAAVFTDGDLVAMRELRAVLEDEALDVVEAVQIARLAGQSLARVGDALVAVLDEQVRGELGAGADSTQLAVGLATGAASSSVGRIEGLIVYAWRRHLAAAIRRTAARGAGGADGVLQCVGFADITGFTGLSAGLDHRRLGALLDCFQSAADDVVVRRGGRIVKTLGDEIMFASEDPALAVEIATALAAGFVYDVGHVDLHVGVARGHVLAREGDFYGPVVNVAKRLTDAAPPGAVLVDAAMAASVATVPGVRLEPVGAEPPGGGAAYRVDELPAG